MMHHPHARSHPPQHPHHGHGMHGMNVPTAHPVQQPHQVQPQMHRDQNRLNQRFPSHAHSLQQRANLQAPQALLMGIAPPHTHAPPPTHNMPPPTQSGVLVTMNTGAAPVVSAHPQVSVGGTKPLMPPLSQTTVNTVSTPIPPPEVEVAEPNVRPENTTHNPSAQTLANNKEKTPMCLVNELARFNKIQHQYRLTSEQGPAHKKRFTVTLKLGDEEYTSEGASIKKAQHSAAADALAQTEYKHPPPKSIRSIRTGNKMGHTDYFVGNITPTVELNALAMKRGEPTVYLLESSQPNINSTTPNSGQFIPPSQNPILGNYNYHRGGNMYHQNRFNNYERRGLIRNFGDNQRYRSYSNYNNSGNEMYTVTLKVGQREFVGQGNTPQSARHDAAAKALSELKQLPIPEEDTCPTNGDTASVPYEEDPNSELKSPISLVHEIALKRNLNVQFEVLSEKGPPHMKVFVTICRVGEVETEGEGNGKKISKKRAAEKMLEELRKLGPISPTPMSVSARIKRKPAAAKKKTRNLIKEKTEPEYNEEINPISRLIQIQQAKKEREPVYNLVEERGASRRREFIMEVRAGGHFATGTGSNKKLAKRAAAENLLTLIEPGIVKPNIKPSIKSDATEVHVEKPRKVTFQDSERSSTPTQNPGGSAGRQLVPGLLLMQDQTASYNTPSKSGVNLQTTATIAKEFLNAGSSPTAEALAKAGHSQKISSSGGTGVSQSPSSLSTTQVIRPKEQLMYLAQLLGFQVQFSDFPKGNHNEFLSLVSLNTDPPQVCHGAGSSTEASHDQAAVTALRLLSEMGLDNVTPSKKESTTVGPNGDGHHVLKSNVKMPKAGILSNGLKK